MKYKTTQKAVKAGYYKVISIGYCNLQSLLTYESPIAYTSRREGWGADIYQVDENTAIATGYAPFGNVRPDYNLCREYEKKADEIKDKYRWNFEEVKPRLHDLLVEFVKEVTA